jgi:hypothetical protein
MAALRHTSPRQNIDHAYIQRSGFEGRVYLFLNITIEARVASNR